MAFSPPEYCRLFVLKKAYQGGVTGTPGPPTSYAPAGLHKFGEFVCGYWAFKISPLLVFHFSMTDFFYKRKENEAPDTISMPK